MKHRVKIKKLNRDTKARKALFKGLVRSLVEKGTIVTTTSKAKEASRIADKLIGKAKTDTLETRRTLHRFFGTRDVVNTLVDRIAPEFTDRISGFTRITKIGVRRGDNSDMAELSLVKAPDTIGSLKNKVNGEARESGLGHKDSKNKVNGEAKKAVVKKVAADKPAKAVKKAPAKKEAK